MSLSMRAVSGALPYLSAITGLSSRNLASEESLRASVDPHRTDAEPPAWFRRRHLVRGMRRDGLPVIEATPRRSARDLDIVYLHGGAYVGPLMPAHWLIVDALLVRTGARVHVPWYALAPEHTAAQSQPAVAALVDDLRAGSRPVVTAGDSAGGGFSLVEAMRVRDDGGKPLAAVVLLSPWVDVTLPSEQSRELEAVDAMLRVDGLRAAGGWWAGGEDPAHWRTSPVNGDLSHLPPITVIQGGRDVLMPDALRLTRLAREAGNDTELHLFGDGFHVFAGIPWLPEARAGLDAAASRIMQAVYGL